MRYKITLMLPLLLATLAVGYMIYRSHELTENGTAVAETPAAVSQYDGSIPGDIYYSSKVESVAFSHETHVIGLQIGCDACHADIFQKKAHSAEAQYDFDMAGLAEGKYCGSCHSSRSETAFPSDSQCARCHLGVKGLEKAAKAGL
ncbi:MAG: hypothetical protein IBX61_08055 [Thermoleophilia bacterium]|nr:hypothetical protein [Thermoleophilia bacterium]